MSASSESTTAASILILSSGLDSRDWLILSFASGGFTVRQKGKSGWREASADEGASMPPRGVKKGTKRARQYEHIKDSELQQGASVDLAEEIAARTVNKARARAGESSSASRSSLDDISSGRRGGLRSGTKREKGRTYAQLYNEARELGIEGRSKMNKSALEEAVNRRKP